MSPGRRFLFYTNECVGLGHLRRTISLAQAVSALDLHASALIVTGSPLSPEERLAPGVDTVKLPQLGRDGDGRHHPHRLRGALDPVQRVRAELARSTAESFEPDVVVVDKAPLGLSGELVSTLEALRGSDARVVLGLRDIEDAPANVQRAWDVSLQRAITRFYDLVLVYGPSWTPDALDVLAWDEIELPVEHVGYVGRVSSSPPPLDLPPEYLLVTVGGGADGFAVAACALEAVARDPLPYPTLVVAGPLMPEADVELLRSLADGVAARVEEFRHDMDAVIAGARAVVSMAGYNTVAEVLRAGRPVLLVPRARPSGEQLVRAVVLEEERVAAVLRPEELEPGRMRKAIERLLEAPQPGVDPLLYDGTARAAAILMRLARSRRAATSVAVAG